MYTLQYLFRKHHTSPNRSFSCIYICISLFFAIYSGFNYAVAYSLLQGLCISAFSIGLSAVYWLGINFWGITSIFSSALAESGLSFVSIYSLESAANSDNIFVDSVSQDSKFNESCILLSPKPMEQLEPLCEANHVGEYFCNISQEQSACYIRRRVAMGKVVTVAFDNYPTHVALDEADCVLLPEGESCQDSPACTYYNRAVYSSAVEACNAYITSARTLMAKMDSFYGNLALRCLLFQFIISAISFVSLAFGAACWLCAALLPFLIILSFISVREIKKEVCNK